MSILYVGIDLAKNVFAVHAVTRQEPPSCASPSLRAKLHALSRRCRRA